MLIDILGAKCVGIEAVPVTVEVDITHGIGIHLVGLADVAVKESLLRTVTALQSLGFRIPGKKIVINLAPADVRKNGSGSGNWSTNTATGRTASGLWKSPTG